MTIPEGFLPITSYDNKIVQRGEMVNSNARQYAAAGELCQPIYKDDRIVVRGAWRKMPNGRESFDVFVNPVVKGVEHQPLGYWLGSNSLIYEMK